MAIPGGISLDSSRAIYEALLSLQTDLLATSPVSVVNAANSSTTNLGASAVFTGTGVDWLLYGSASIYAYASHASATNGLSIQQSHDNTNWFITDTYTISATSSKVINVDRKARYLRVVYTNGATLTTTFVLSTILNQHMPRAVSVKPTDTMTIENDMDQAISIQMSYNGTSLDLQRSIANATNSTGTGIIAAGLVAQFDDTSPTAITENQFGNLRMSAARAQYVEVGPYLSGRVVADGQIKASGGFVHSVSIAPITATPTAGLLTIYNSLTETGTVLYSEWIFATTPGHTVILDVPAGTGIYVGFDATLANVQVSVSYR